MSSAAELDTVLAAGGPGLAAGLRRTEERLAGAAANHGEVLAGHAGGTLAAGGKRLRPLLLLVCAGQEDPGDHVVAGAAAVELLHTATLVHDDVLDGAPLRRGRTTVFAAAGRDAAVAAGDLMFARAFAELAATGCAPAIAALSEASSALAAGELAQRADAWSPSVTVARYLERCRLKTGSLFAAASRLGALLVGRRADVASVLGDFGLRIGLAFQILDDVLDVSGPAERTGKRRGTDLLDGTVTLPLILARERDAELASLDLRADVRDGAAAEAVCERVAATGALDEARATALGHVESAKAALAGVELAATQRRTLAAIADGVVARYA
jgi:geranylgeranyl pyrophosphate synthase